MKKLLVLFVVVFAALAMFADDVEWLVENVSGGQRGGTLYLTTTDGPKSLNSYQAQETSSTDILDWLFDTPMQANNKGIVSLQAMAKDFSVKETEKGVIYTFTLRKGLKWSDGEPITADDFVFTAEKIAFVNEMTANGNGAYLDDKDNLPVVKKVDDYTVSFTYTESKFRQGYTMLGGMTIFPKHYFADKVDTPEHFKQTWTVNEVDKLVTSGPFILAEYKEGVRLVLKRNPNYYAKSKDGVQLPYLDQVVYNIVPNSNTELLKFEAGESDLYGPTAKDFPQIKAEASEKGWNVVIGGPALGSQFIAFNFNAPDKYKRAWFRDVNFRKAVAYAFDKQSIIDNLYNGLGVPLYGPTSSSSGFYNPEVENLGYRFSISKAKRYLKKAGFTWNSNGKLVDKDGNIVKYTLSTNTGNTVREEIGNILADSLAKLGIEVVFRPIAFNTLVQKLFGGDWDSIIIGLTGGVDLGNGWNVNRLDGGLHFWNYSPETQDWVDKDDYFVPDYEKRIDEIFKEQAVTLNQDKLKELFNEYQMLVAENQILVYTVAQNYLVAYKKSVHIFNPTPSPAAGSLWKRYCIWKETK